MTRRKNLLYTMFFIAFLGWTAVLHPSPARAAEMEGIEVAGSPSSVHIVLSEKAPYKVVKFDSREILVAFRDVEMAGSFEKKGLGGPDIRDVSVTRTQKGVVSIVITTNKDVASLSSRWTGDGTLAVVPVWSVKKPAAKTPVAARKDKPPVKPPHTEKAPKGHGAVKARKAAAHGPDARSAHHPVAHAEPSVDHEKPRAKSPREKSRELAAGHETKIHGKPVAVKSGEKAGDHGHVAPEPGVHEKQGHGEGKPGVDPSQLRKEKELLEGLKNKGGGNLKTSDELYRELTPQGCENQSELIQAKAYADKGKWAEAFEIFDRYSIDPKAGKSCREYAALFKAYTYFKDLETSDREWKNYVKAADYFQDVISFYPDSPYAPYAMSSLGRIYLLMGDISQAEGYFQIVLSTYKDRYPGIPEIMFELGWIYTEKNDTQLAIDTLKDVVARFPGGEFIGKAKLKLGKAFFNTADFQSAIRIFEEVVAEKPRMVFESPELLLFLGNAYYQTGKREKALENLLKVYNLFPQIEGRDTLLTRIGDILLETGRKDQAVKVFKLVTKKYPKTDGFVISTMRLAEYLENREEKEKMYTMVISDFRTNPLSQLAMLRLALLENEAGEYEKSIETVKNLLVMRPKDLQKEAVSVIQDSSAHVFKKLLEKGEHMELISSYEADRKYLDDTEKPELFFYVGMAYLKSHLFPNAVDTLLKAYNRTGERRRSEELIGSLGMAMDEAGRDEEALGMFETYLKRFPGGADAVSSHIRMGQIYFERKKFGTAIATLKKAYEKTGDSGERVRILLDISKNHAEIGNHKAAVVTLDNAAALLAKDPEGNAEMLVSVYKGLAENHMKQKQWEKAVTVLDKALKITTEPSDLTEIYFQMGEAHHHLRNNEEATLAYTYVVDNGDTFWSGMAKERLRVMNLKAKLDKNN